MVNPIMERRGRNSMWARNVLFIGLVGAGGVGLIGGLFPRSIAGHATREELAAAPPANYLPVVEGINRAFRQQWSAADLSPAPPAADLTVARRLALALTGSIPSLQEIRRLEAEPEGRWLESWLPALLTDRLFADSFAGLLAAALPSPEGAPFVPF